MGQGVHRRVKGAGAAGRQGRLGGRGKWADGLTAWARAPRHAPSHRPRSCHLLLCSSLPPMSFSRPQDVKKGSIILCADGSISLEVLATNPAEGTVRVKCLNTATLG